MKQQFTYVEPEEYILGSGPLNKPESMQYIPILRTLNALLKHEDVLGQVLENHRSQDGMVRDFCDGDVFKNSPLFQRHENALQIELYDDEFTCTNPLRRRAKKHKLFAVYFLLGNLAPKYRSKLDMIQLAALCPQELVKKYGISAVLAPIIKDIQTLETEGISVEFEGRIHHFYGTVSFVAADNLAAHAVGGGVL